MRHKYPQGRPSVTKKSCQECAKQLTVRNRSGYCAQHRYLQNRPSVATQACKKCGTQLRFNNKSGYCQDHYYLSPQAQDLRKTWKRGRALKTKIVQDQDQDLLEKQGIVGQPKGGRPAEDKTAAKIDPLYKQRMRWPAIKKKLNTTENAHRSADAYRKLYERWLKRQKRTKPFRP
jgi:hypothetical protein